MGENKTGFKLQPAYKLTAVLFSFLFFNIAAFSQSFNSPAIREILTLQDQRTLGENNKLLSYLNSSDPEIIARVMYALANIGDSTTVNLIGEQLLNSSSKDVRSMAAFALGQIPSDASEKFLTDALGIEKDPEIIGAILNAAGKIGKEQLLETVLYFNPDIPQVKEMQALSIGRFAIRRIFNQGSVSKLVDLYPSSTVPVQRYIAYALWRTGDKELLIPAENVILSMLNETDDLTKMWAVNAMGRLKNADHISLLAGKFSIETDWRIRTNILNALVNYKAQDSLSAGNLILELLKEASFDDNPNVRITALNLTGRLFSGIPMTPELENDLEIFLGGYSGSGKAADWQEKGEALNSYAMIFKDEAKDLLLREYSLADNYDLKSYIVKAFGNFDDGMIYRTVRDTISADVQEYNIKFPNTTGEMIGSEDLAKLYRAFVDMLSDLDKKVDDENRNIMRLIFYEFISSKDPYITSVSVGALLDSVYMDQRSETASIFKFDFNDLRSPEDDLIKEIFISTFGELKDSSSISMLESELSSGDYDIAKAAAEALANITGKEYTIAAKLYADYDWQYLNSINKKSIRIITEKGNIKLELYPDFAPFTVMNFLKLMEKGFFNGDIFHRVVPNFVIQDGDPTGTGYGGPGYSIRSEFSLLTYTTGTLGMASSGKDTEGSQFFITHSPQPHLDGKYTIFGQVTEGQDIVDRIIYGDRIDRIEIE